MRPTPDWNHPNEEIRKLACELLSAKSKYDTKFGELLEKTPCICCGQVGPRVILTVLTIESSDLLYPGDRHAKFFLNLCDKCVEEKASSILWASNEPTTMKEHLKELKEDEARWLADETK